MMPEPIHNSSQRNATFRKVITVLASAFVLVHLILSAYIIISSNAKSLGSSALVKIYKYYTLSGPYFKDETIESSPYCYIAGKKGGLWQDWRNPEAENFKLYHQSYWRYNKLKQSQLEQRLAKKLCRVIKAKGDSAFTNYPEFKAFHKYFYNEYFTTGADSIRLMYTTATFKPRELKTKIDTLLLLKYKP